MSTPGGRVAVWAEEPQLPAAAGLAERLGLPRVERLDDGRGLLLVVGPSRLELRETGPLASGAVFVDWVSGPMGYRRRHGGGRGQALARAVGLRKGRPAPWVVDATAGLGRDAVVLATLGCRVTAVERCGVLVALLQDGLRRALEDPELSAVLREQLELRAGDAREVLAEMGGSGTRPEVVYLDPMHPPRRKSALVKKEMRVLRQLAGEDSDAVDLLAVARTTALERVVVKRPAHGEPLAASPQVQIKGRSTRYDVYLAGGALSCP